MPPDNASASVVIETTLTIGQLDVSPHNVRTHRADIDDTAVLEASILERGLIQAIAVHPMKGRKDRFGAFAGGRRYRSIRNLVARGDLPADWPVPVREHRGFTDAQLIEMSIAENLIRRDLRDYELFTAVRKANAKGDSVETIAAVLGQDPKLVGKWLRMGQLAEPVFAAFRAGQLSLDQAQAFAATEDQQVQLAAWDALRVGPAELRPGTDPARIRAAMNIGDVELGRLLMLVGADQYRAAGGAFELDLFASEIDQRGRVVDDGLLRRLAEARLEAVRADARRRAGRPELRFTPRAPENGYGGTDYALEVHPDGGEGDALTLPDGDVVATVAVRADGQPETRYWWASRAAKFGNRRQAERDGPKPTGADAVRDPYTYAAPARAAVKEEHGASADGLEVIRSMRRELLRALLVEDAQRGDDRARDFATWAQLRVLLGHEAEAACGMRAPSRGDNMVGVGLEASQRARAQVEQHVAHDIWRGAVRQVLAQGYMTETDLAAAFVDFLNAGAADKRIAEAVVAGLVLERSANAPGFRSAGQDGLAAMIRGTDAYMIRKIWSPTAEFLQLLPKTQLLAIAAEITDDGTLAKWEKAKAADLARLLAQALAGGGHAVPSRHRKAAADWVHPLLAFRALDFSQPAPSAEAPAPSLLEAQG